MLGLVASATLVGGLAIGTALIAAHRGVAMTRAPIFIVVALALPYAAAASLLFAALCGMS